MPFSTSSALDWLQAAASPELDIHVCCRQQKRKVEEGEDGHHEFDASQLREHEEFTKVKNVERIELGRFEMETWYFSPLPPEYKDCKVRKFSQSESAESRTTGPSAHPKARDVERTS